jgi:methylated-DNA-[protein]-cysteine S-methyltransferase
MRGLDRFVAMTFRTRLGWMAALAKGSRLSQLTINHESPAKALASLDHEGIASAGGALKVENWDRRLAARLQAFSEGTPDDFLDIEVEPFWEGAFAARVIRCCRRIPWGQTLSYGDLAERARAPRAARAVGNVMRQNRLSLVIPCHRVVRAGGALGGYGSPAGVQLKRRLLALEAGHPA